MKHQIDTRPQETVLVIDDSPEMIDILGEILRPLYQVRFSTNGTDALALVQRLPPSLILLDVMMTGMSGHEVCSRLKTDLRTRDTPVIFITSSSDPADEQLGLELGAVDYLHKPLNPPLVIQRVRIHLELRNQNLTLENKVLERTRQLEDTQMAGLSESLARLLLHAAPMHDIGKIGIPDRILLKSGKLDTDEWVVMKTHTLIGAEIIGNHESPLLQMARSVALTHHEKWDGSGYPHGLIGDAIPMEGRLVALSDVYDALTSERPYKPAWPPEDAFAFIRDQAGAHFDPELVSLFLKIKPEIIEITEKYRDTATARRNRLAVCRHDT